MTVLSVLDAAGRRRSTATLPGYHAGRPPRNKGIRYPADPPTLDEIVSVMRHTSDDRHGWRVRGDGRRLVARRATHPGGAGALRAQPRPPARIDSRPPRQGRPSREVGMDEWRWEHLRPWLNARTELPVGPLLCIIDGPTRGRPWSGAAVRGEFRSLAARAGVRRRFAPHQLRHALELAREGVPLNIIQRQLGHANLGTTSIYLQGINPEEIIAAMPTRRAPDDVRQRRAPALNDSGGGSVTRRFRSAMPKRVPVRHWSRRSCLVHGGRAGLDRRRARSRLNPGAAGCPV